MMSVERCNWAAGCTAAAISAVSSSSTCATAQASCNSRLAPPGRQQTCRRVLRLFGMCNCTPDFVQPPQVIDGASDLFFELWGPELGKHARSAVGHVSLPRGIAVEINGEFELHG